MNHITYFGKSKVILRLCELVNDLFDSGVGAEDFTGATSESAGTHGLVPAPQIGDQGATLLGNATWGHDPVIMALIADLDARVTALEHEDHYALCAETGEQIMTEDGQVLDFEGA